MTRLLLKIFFAYWAVAAIVIAISDFEPHRHIHNPELTDALDSALRMEGRRIADAYESGHCQQFQKLASGSKDGLYLATADGRLVCGDNQVPDVTKLVAAAEKYKKRTTDNYAWFQVLALPITSPEGAKY